MTSREEGKDVQLLRAVCNNTFEKIAESVSEERFFELFREFVPSKSKNKSKIQKLCGYLQSSLKEDLNECLNDLIEEEKLDEKFIKRADLLQKQKEFEGTSAWRPTGDPKKDQLSHDMGAFMEIKSAMEEYLREKEPYVEELLEKVRQDRKEAADLQATTDQMFDKIDVENKRLDEFEENSLKILKALAPPSQSSEENY